jgi:hypothetical protein
MQFRKAEYISMLDAKICKDGFCCKMHFVQTHGNRAPVVQVPALSTIPQEHAVACAHARKTGGGSARIYLRKIKHVDYFDDWYLAK